MTKKSVCVWHRRVLLLAMAVFLGVSGYAPPARAALPVIDGALITKTAINFAEQMAQALQDYAMQKFLQKTGAVGNMILQAVGYAIVENDKALAQNAVEANAVNEMAASADRSNNTYVATLSAQGVAAGARTADLQTDARRASEGLCLNATQNDTLEKGGAAGPPQRARGYAQVANNRVRARGNAPPPSAADVAAIIAAVGKQEFSAGAVNATGSNKARGLQTYKDQSDIYFRYYAGLNDFGGGLPEEATQNVDENKVGLDTRAGDLLSGSPPSAYTLLCFEDETGDGEILHGFKAGLCPRNQSWEQAVAANPAEVVPDYATFHVIKDYFVPGGLTPFTKPVLQAMYEGDTGVQEVFAKRQALSNVASLINGVFEDEGGRRAPQDMSEADHATFQANWKQVFGESSTPPRYPSLKAREEVIARTYGGNVFVNKLNSGANPQVEAAAAIGVLVAQQHQLNNTMNDLKLLITAMLARQASQDRMTIEQSINAANRAFTGSGGGPQQGEAAAPAPVPTI